jgi:hypothetical protein
MDEVYRLVPEKAPFFQSETNDEATDSFDKCFFVCHRALLSAATAIGSSIPEDGEAVTRRALEVAKTCLAIKADPANGEAWLSSLRRIRRWQERDKGAKPKSFQPQYRNLDTEPLFEEIQSKFGALSDFSVHFTPEYFGRYNWQKVAREDGGFDISFGLGVGAIELAFLMLISQHDLIIQVFDRCQDGKILGHSKVMQALRRTRAMHERYRRLLAPTMDALVTATRYEL